MYQRHSSLPVLTSSAATQPRVPPSPAPFWMRTLPSATSGAVRNFSWPPNSFLPAIFLSQTISPLSRLMAMTRPSGRLARTRSSQSAMPRVRGALPSCRTPGSAIQTNSPLSRVARVDLVDRAPAVGRVHEAVVDERIDLVLRTVLPDVLHAAERQRPHHPQVLDVVAVDLRELGVARRAVVAVHQQPVLRLVRGVDQPVPVDGEAVSDLLRVGPTTSADATRTHTPARGHNP